MSRYTIASTMKFSIGVLAVSAHLALTALGEVLRTDNGTAGPSIEEVHYYYTEWPTGVAVSSTGRIFTSFLRGGNSYQYTLGEVVNMTTERAYPSQPSEQGACQRNFLTTQVRRTASVPIFTRIHGGQKDRSRSENSSVVLSVASGASQNTINAMPACPIERNL